MSRTLSKILILVLMVGIFFAPVGDFFEKNNGKIALTIETKKAEASLTSLQLLTGDISGNNSTYPTTFVVQFNASDIADLSNSTSTTSGGSAFSFTVSDSYDQSTHAFTGTLIGQLFVPQQVTGPQSVTIHLNNSLSSGTQYYARASYYSASANANVYSNVVAFKYGDNSTVNNNYQASTVQTSTTTHDELAETIGGEKLPAAAGWDFKCSVTSGDGIVGCFAWIVYYVIWYPLNLVASLAGQVLDFFIYYSTNSSSYSDNFVGTAWAAVRDIANIFFIVALLFVAIKTILGDGHSGKKMIASIVVVALLINFSLFFTQVLIDGTNILARVFYNNINVINKDSTSAAGAEGERSISAALVSTFNPQTLVTADEYGLTGGPGAFITITLLSAAISAIMIWIFLSVALLFVARVAGLYIAMIFAPIAFASYTMPINIPGVGHKEWWDNLWKQAFMAPIFIFFLYIILLMKEPLKKVFGDSYSATGGIGITGAHNGANASIDGLLKVVVPFALVTVLLFQAKELAVKYSGSIGKGINAVGSFIGGAAVGLATGGVAVAGRATLGRAGSAIANSATLKNWESKGYLGAKTLRNIGTSAGKGSFDLRGAKVAGKSLADTGLKVGKAQEGGFVKMRADKTATRLKRAKELEVGADETLARNVRGREADLDDVKSDPTIMAAHKAAENAYETAKDIWKGSGATIGSTQHVAMVAAQAAIRTTTLSTAEAALKTAQNAMTTENKTRGREYAKYIKSGSNKATNMITSRFQHSNFGADEASDRIRARATT